MLQAQALAWTRSPDAPTRPPCSAADLHDFVNFRKPHVFAVADHAYRCMLDSKGAAHTNQAMIVSGESGAGKTEAAKQVMKYLTALSGRYMAQVSKKAGTSAPTGSIEVKVLKSNPFLEAFGNAKTLRNNNSSRFGKFLKIQYIDGGIVGATMEHYLLEKARVVKPLDGERNFHIFYQLALACPDELRADFQLQDPSKYDYLTHGGCVSVDNMDDVAEFGDVVDGLSAVGIDSALQASMWRVVAAVMHLGNVRFKDVPTKDSDNKSQIKNPDVAEVAAELFGAMDLPRRLVTQKMKVGVEVVQRHQDARKAKNSRNAVAKHVYDKMFTWLISRVNSVLANPEGTRNFIGILDIFGFEIFKVNSFEQLCINFANEKLQSLFNTHIFTLEQETYRLEGIDVTSIKFRNNQPCVELIEAGAKHKKYPPGILTLLDDVCRGGQQGMTDEKFLNNVTRAHSGKNEYFVSAKIKSADKFAVKHFAGKVTYTVKNFIGKNNDKLNDDLTELLMESKVSFVRTLFSDGFSAGEGAMSTAGQAAATPPSSPRKKATGAPTIGGRFKRQLKHLYDTLLHTNPHYIRTIKPNEVKKPHVFDSPKILEQLLYSGVLETVRIRREGYPFREPYIDFWRRATRCGQARGYIHMVPECASVPLPPLPKLEERGDGTMVDTSITPAVSEAARRGTAVLLKGLLADDEWASGHTKIFMKDGCLDRIHKKFRALVMNDIMNFVKRRVRWMRMRYARANRLRRRICVRHLVRRYRAWQLKKKYMASIKYVTKLQAHIKGRHTRAWFVKHKRDRITAATKIQATFRMFSVNKSSIRGKWALRKVQAAWRAKLAQREHSKRLAQILKVQCIARAYIARKRVRKVLDSRQEAAVKLQAFMRARQQRAKFVVFRAQVFTSASKKVQALARGFIARRRLAKQHAAATRIQATIKARQAKVSYSANLAASKAINRWIIGNYRRWALREWIAETFACASNGYAEDVAELLARTQDMYRWLRDIPQHDLARLRDPDDGFKSLMHASALSGDLETTRLLVQVGCSVEVADVTGCTPLHKAAAIGDSHLPVVQYMVNLLPQTPDDAAHARVTSLSARYVVAEGVPGAPASSADVERAWGKPYATRQLCFVNLPSAAGETALDCAVAIQRSRGRREHDDTIHYLLSVGGISHIMGSRDAVLGLLQGLQSDAAVAAAAAARERELLERRRLEREHNPHYQFLLVQEQARKSTAEKAKLAAAKKSREEAQARIAQRDAALAPSTSAVSAAPRSGSTSSSRAGDGKAPAQASRAASAAGPSSSPKAGGSSLASPSRVASSPNAFSAGGVSFTFPAEETAGSAPPGSDGSPAPAQSSQAQASASPAVRGAGGPGRSVAASPAAATAEFMQSLAASGTAAGSTLAPDPYSTGPSTTASEAARGLGGVASFSGSSSPDTVSLTLKADEAAALQRTAAQHGVALNPAAAQLLSHSAGTTSTSPRMGRSGRSGSRESKASAEAEGSPSGHALARGSKPSPLGEGHSDSEATAEDIRSHRSVSAWALPGSSSASKPAAEPAALQVPQPSANPSWSVHQSNSTGLLYFHNASTGSTQWTEPEGFDAQYEPWMLEVLRKTDVPFTLAMQRDGGLLEGGGVDLAASEGKPATSPAAELASTYGVKGSSGAAPGALAGDAAIAAADAEDGPPSRWEVYETDDGIPYFYDKLTDSTTWDKPSCLAAREGSSTSKSAKEDSPSPSASDAGAEPMDGKKGGGGWTSYVDDEGYVYYHNERTGVTQWDKPAAF